MQSTFIVHFLTLFSLTNAFYTFWRKRHYRLFENNVDNVPSTPSAHRVRVDSSPVASSPLRFLSKIIGTEAARARAHPDPQRDVWELAVWDPLPVSLRLFCYFSPGHVIIYWLFLPTLPSDTRPSTTVATAILVAVLLSFQLSILQSSFSQQIKDAGVISKEVLHEYDTKYVRPRTQPLYRDVGTQFSEQASHSDSGERRHNNVETYTPRVVINRGFKPNPNPNYVHHIDPDATSSNHGLRHQTSTPNFKSPLPNRDPVSAIRPLPNLRQPSFRPTGDGGSLGVYSHAASPLRKSASTNFTQSRPQYLNDGSHETISMSPERRALSPSKRMSVPPQSTSTAVGGDRWSHIRNDRNRRESGRF